MRALRQTPTIPLALSTRPFITLPRFIRTRITTPLVTIQLKIRGWGRNCHNPTHCPDLSRAAASCLLFCPNTLQFAGNSERGKRNLAQNNDATPAHDTRGLTRGKRGGKKTQNPFTTQRPAVFGDTRPQVYVVVFPHVYFFLSIILVYLGISC